MGFFHSPWDFSKRSIQRIYFLPHSPILHRNGLDFYSQPVGGISTGLSENQADKKAQIHPDPVMDEFGSFNDIIIIWLVGQGHPSEKYDFVNWDD